MQKSSENMHSTTESASTLKPHPNINLVAWSLWGAILLDFSPIGGDPLFAAYHARSVLVVTALATTYAALILAPLALIVRRDGIRGFRIAPIRITIILFMVTFHAVSDVLMIMELTR